jgi:hypothetical protein
MVISYNPNLQGFKILAGLLDSNFLKITEVLVFLIFNHIFHTLLFVSSQNKDSLFL